jgi:UDP-galactopyranose mutase
VITREYPSAFTPGDEPYYPVNDERNMRLYEKYKELAIHTPGVLFGGRLAQYAYFDMDDTVAAALVLAQNEL